jgi:hypothetical protein
MLSLISYLQNEVESTRAEHIVLLERLVDMELCSSDLLVQVSFSRLCVLVVGT